MPRMVAPVAAAVFAAALLSAAPAAAHWDKTRWGMSVEQVEALYPQARPATPAGNQSAVLELPGSFVWDGRTWTKVRFNFQGDRGLAVVSMQTDASFETIRAYLATRYGPPIDDTGPGPMRLVGYADPASRDDIWITHTGTLPGATVSWAPPRKD